jgi:hypothetical protein
MGECGKGFTFAWELVLMNSCRLRHFVRMFLLFCLLAMMWQQAFLHGLILDVKGETTLTSNGSIDLYTQKEPFNGRGTGQPSDAFAPQELVILYAYVTYNLYPEQNKIVAFQMIGPPNPIYNFSIVMSSQTNANGIAQISFRIPWPDENAETQIFGTWTAIATVDIAEQAVMDTLTFQVGWIVELLRVETVDVNSVSRTSFTKGERVCFKLTVRNIAMTDKVATLIIDAYDNSSVPLGQLLVEDVRMSPGVNVFFIEDLLIPTWACLGVSLVVVNAYTELPSVYGKPWCPQASTTFLITKLIVHDVAVVSVVPSATKVFPCDVVYITVIVKNEGDKAETFNVTAYYNETVIDTKIVADLPSGVETTLMFAWSTCVPIGNYTISAVASIILGETDIKDNTFIDGVVQVIARPSLPQIHDVAVLSVQSSKTLMYIGEVVEIYVIVKNQGNYAETFSLTAYADLNTTVIGDEITVGTWIVRNLEPNAEKPLVFHWNTWNVAEGNYTLSAEASTVPGEINIENNKFVDNVVWVKPWALPAVWEIPRWLLALLFISAILIGACLVAAIVFAMLRRRKRKRKDQTGRQSSSFEVEPYKEVGFKRSKACSVCGKEFPGAYTFCPYCFTFHGKDYE